MSRSISHFVFTTMLLFAIASPQAFGQQDFVANYDEAKIPEFNLPNPLLTVSGETVDDAATWNKTRRPELLDLFTQQVFGTSPPPVEISHEIVSTEENALGGKAVRREIDVFFDADQESAPMRLLVYTPKGVEDAPAFLGLNFQGNHTVDSDPTISLNANWMRDRKGTKDNRATEGSRGIASSRWPIEMIIDRGYALVTIYYGDIDPDFDDGFENGIHAQFKAGSESVPSGERWGSIAAWAFGLSRALDYLERDPLVDGSRVAVMGHSRLGKTSLWAGATDPRFKLVISNNSGCGGAALSRRAIGETIGRINTSFPHWFCDNYLKYNNNEDACPVDQHELIALMAPRAVYVASATEDKWADPKGEFLSCLYADPVFRLLGTDGFGGSEPPSKMPEADTPINAGTIGYHLRTGGHNVTDYDWSQYLDFADRHVK